MNLLRDDREHAAVLVQVNAWKAEIDAAIAPLIREIWIAGIETSMSCQEDQTGKVWIEFPELDNLVRFLNITAKYETGTETLYNRMNNLLRLADPRSGWEYELFPVDASLIWPAANDSDEQFRYDGAPDFFFMCGVRFPVADLSTVFRRMQEHNRLVLARLGAASID